MSTQWKYQKVWALVACLVVAALLLSGCGGLGESQPKTYIIGVARENAFLDAALSGFKSKMAELGYVEGKNVTYIDHGVLGTDPQKNESEIKSLMGQKADLLLTLGTAPSLAAKKAMEDTKVPVVFVPVSNPVGIGLVASIGQPGGNITGIQSIITAPKALEWLLKIAPGTKRVYIPYHPADQVSLTIVKSLPDTAAKLGIELILDEVSSGDEELVAIKALPKDSAILIITSPSLNPGLENALKLAVELGIPTGSNTGITQDKTLFTYTINVMQSGQQAAVLANKILKGTKPGDLPVETADVSLTINLKTAQAIGINIPDEILNQAQTINR